MHLRVLHVIASVDPAQGGPVEALRAGAALRSARGQHVEVVTLDPPDAPFIPCFPFPVHAQGPTLHKYGYTRRLTPWVQANAQRFDVAVLHGLWNYSSLGAWRALTRVGLPYIVFTHGMMDPWFREAYPLKHFAKDIYWHLLQGRILRAARFVLFTSDEERRLARTTFPNSQYRERVVAYGAADVTDRPADQIAAFARKIRIAEGRRYLLFMGRVHPKKGCDLLIRALAASSTGSEYDLVIAGPARDAYAGSLRDLARSLGVEHRVHWTGLLEGDAKWGAFRGARAFILPSHQENFGIVVAEAMSCGTPVLISRKVNIWREVEQSGGGLVQEDTLPGTIALMSALFAMSESTRTLMAVAARRGYEKYFSIREAVLDMEATLTEACADRRQARSV